MSFKLPPPFLLLSIFQRYKMKANHNWLPTDIYDGEAVINISKIQNESKSQRIFNCGNIYFCCYQYFKDTK